MALSMSVMRKAAAVRRAAVSGMRKLSPLAQENELNYMGSAYPRKAAKTAIKMALKRGKPV